MNAKRKEKAVKDFAMFAGQEVIIEKLIEAGYNEDTEIQEIITAINQSVSGETVTKKINLSELNETEDEDGQIVFTECNNFKQYQKAIEKMNGSKMVDFIKVNAVGCFRTAINSRGEKVQRLVGIKTLKEKPLHKTKIDIHTANRLNAQIWNTNNLPECSIYYLVESLINY